MQFDSKDILNTTKNWSCKGSDRDFNNKVIVSSWSKYTVHNLCAMAGYMSKKGRKKIKSIETALNVKKVSILHFILKHYSRCIEATRIT
jgi:hypothetical protein